MNCNIIFRVAFAYELAKNNDSFILNRHISQACSLFLAYVLCGGAQYPENSSKKILCYSC